MYWDDATDHLTLGELADIAEADAEMARWQEDRMRERLLAGETGFDALAQRRLRR